MAQIKKKFFEVELPLLKKEMYLHAYNIESLNNRYVKYDLTRFLRGKNTILTAKVKVEGDKATTIPFEIKVLPYFLRKMIRKGTNYVEDSIVLDCKDSKIKIKPFLITRRKVSRAVRKALREMAREELTNYCKNHTADTIFKDIIQGKIQKPLSLKLKKVYPLSLCEIRIFKVEKYN
jgi:ribosomal protein S3AE